ncbi:hypothetical protein Peur_069435 [Populus x canadensis]
MLQEADISVGISGVEGMQAVMSSDITVAQFRYLERSLLVHGHRCFRRISSMAYVSFSGQQAYNDWFLSLYNVFFNSLPVIALGVFDQDVSARFCLKILHGFREGGEVVIGLEILGATLYTCIVLVVNCQMALSINYFTSIQHLFIWGGIVFWFIFLMVYGAILDPYLSTTAYKVFIEAPLNISGIASTLSP